MRAAIFGCRDGAYLQEQIRKNSKANMETVCFCDNNTAFHNTDIDGIPVVSTDKLSDMYKNGELDKIIIAVRKGYSRYCIIKQLNAYGINDILLVRPSPLTYRIPIVFDKNDPTYPRFWVSLRDEDKPIIHHIETHAADGCNLNCRGCLHFSNLLPRDQFPDLYATLNDVREIAKHCEVFQFRVLGGEPLLNPNLEEFLSGLRDALPYSDISVISNGILIPHADESLFRVMAECNIGFNLTLYPPTIKMMDRIEDILKKHGVAYGSHVAKTDEFERFMTLDIHDEEKHNAYKSCEPRGIMVLKEGKLYKCPVVAYGKIYATTFDINYQTKWDGVDIYDSSINWNEVVEALTDKPIDMCRYCGEKSEFFTWSVGAPSKEDWLICGR